MKRYLVALSALLLSGCVVQQTEVVSPTFDQQLKPPVQSYGNGSIWQASSIALTEDGKARRIGDIVTIIVTETASASKQAATATGRSSQISAGIPNMLGLEESKIITSNFADLSKLLNASASSSFDGSGSTSRKETLTATISAKVIDVLPNGNLKVEGRRNVKVNYEDQIVTVKGTIRQRDITAENTINSIYVADAQISYSGEGIITDRQKPGWLMNVLDKLWPF
ncbi:flagellar L-ring protein precursor FlgH [Trichlorobacter thiogenes]|uniref:Flagellar L-ring protein n=1 Tax=Trichlorobacter thiogenes TaxID=115783 RepID=A0A1T4JSU0_9BACT|nr:flagellar basal body L-ring protein FlgH [Trichlorobacter thiogenes]SJZ33185.1 flagellar L-ring protein precursor FlgH [Trichlorobacter thiogenes]